MKNIENRIVKLEEFRARLLGRHVLPEQMSETELARRLAFVLTTAIQPNASPRMVACAERIATLVDNREERLSTATAAQGSAD